ncbi:Uracil permease [Thermus sp. CCB_US3_UF1]|uniref:uracil-xanthine permease family protein n=1 Tax=unclassified Thermus TaxID=2619321 RepID=UPI0002389355|nr:MULTISPECIES: solute carrier family 23 protein [unclassified Thermus]AEV17238.1 Uracil permease [Thermus sp. CCB_US3_UF1]MCS6867654.1 NCS2 family nucleobase:cation symporter [Thermus sp.]MCX7848859.1 NCS2 family nucleobase:cation symporter [Thermus sp.]MDW8016752.1 solute carrier family 23 protein [Thermus sp.]MDW8357454.1 solute carrier family 23 protein [Thermus sp.]
MTPRHLILGLQHTVAMFGATVLVPLLTGLNPAVALFTAGLGTLVFHLVTGRVVPVFLGSSFAFIAPILAAKEAGFSLAAVGGGIAAAGLVYALFALLVRLIGSERVRWVFPPVVTGPVIVVIGLTLAPVAVQMASKDWLLASFTFLSAVVSAVFFRGLFQMIPVLLGVGAGYLLALALGRVDLKPLAEAPWWGLPAFTPATLEWGAILLIAPVAFVTVMEHIGDILTNGRVVGKDFFQKPGLHRTLLGDGLATSLAGLLGGPANTTYSENTGVLAVTKVYDPLVLRIAAVFAILLSFSPKLAALLQTLPQGVLGGVSMLLFGMIASIGIRTLAEAEIDFTHSRNLIVVSAILVLGLGGAVAQLGTLQVAGASVPLKVSGMALAALVGVVLNLLLPRQLEPKELAMEEERLP